MLGVGMFWGDDFVTPHLGRTFILREKGPGWLGAGSHWAQHSALLSMTQGHRAGMPEGIPKNTEFSQLLVYLGIPERSEFGFVFWSFAFHWWFIFFPLLVTVMLKVLAVATFCHWAFPHAGMSCFFQERWHLTFLFQLNHYFLFLLGFFSLNLIVCILYPLNFLCISPRLISGIPQDLWWLSEPCCSPGFCAV